MICTCLISLSLTFVADLAGFTQWSSARQPEDVFTLLETLYNAFDKIAMKRKVFKVCPAIKI